MYNSTSRLVLPRPAVPYVQQREDIDGYVAELGGAVDILAQAQAATGDDKIVLLDLAADAWYAARRGANIRASAFAVERLIEFENELMVAAGILPVVYLELSEVYTMKRLSVLRALLARLGA